MPVATLTAVDGGSVKIDSPLDFSMIGATTFLVARIAQHLQEFGAGELAFGDHVAQATEVSFEEEYSVQGGRLRLGSAEHTDQAGGLSPRSFRLGVWSGKAYCVKTFIYNRPTSELIDIFRLFSIDERDDGVVLNSTRGDVPVMMKGAQVPKVVNNIQGLGLLEIRRLTPEIKRQFPPWDGLPVRGGGIFHDDPRGQGEGSLVLLGLSAVTRVYRDPALLDEEFVDAASELLVTWS